jgi:hypothetical protein
MKPKPELCGVAEAAEIIGVSKQTIYNWRVSTSMSFPTPIAELKMGPIWYEETIVNWNKDYIRSQQLKQDYKQALQQVKERQALQHRKQKEDRK